MNNALHSELALTLRASSPEDPIVSERAERLIAVYSNDRIECGCRKAFVPTVGAIRALLTTCPNCGQEFAGGVSDGLSITWDKF